MLQDIRSLRRGPGFHKLPPEREAEAVLLTPEYWTPGVEPHVPTDIAPPRFDLTVSVTHGRWLVECPCGSAQLASRTDRRFFCVECGNIWAEGMWVRVVWPDEPGAIEEELEKRPFPKNRNWYPTETIEQLREETTRRMAELEVVLMRGRTP